MAFSSFHSQVLFLSQVGGQLSIWLGIRLLTTIHLLYYGFVVIARLCSIFEKVPCRY